MSELKKEKMLNAIRVIEKRTGKVPTFKEYQSHAKELGVNTNIRDYFKTWNNAIRSAGLQERRISYTREELIEIIKELAKKLDKTPTQKDFEKDPKLPSYMTIKEHFGQYNNAMIICGLEINQHAIYRKEELEKILIEFEIKNKRLPRASDFDGIRNKPCTSIFNRKYNMPFSKMVESVFNIKYELKRSKFANSIIYDDIRFDSQIEASAYAYYKNKIRDKNLTIHAHIFYKDFIKDIDRDFISDFVVKTKSGQLTVFEVAGMINEKQFKGESKVNSIEKRYIEKLKAKIEVLEKNNIKYQIIFKNFRRDFKKVMEEVLNDKNSFFREREFTSIKKQKYADEDLLVNLENIYNKIKRIPSFNDTLKFGDIYPSIYTKRKKWNDWVCDLVNRLDIPINESEVKSRKLLEYKDRFSSK